MMRTEAELRIEAMTSTPLALRCAIWRGARGRDARDRKWLASRGG